MPPTGSPRHEAICRAALEVVAEDGYDRMSMDAVAARARASKATIYRHWAGKRDLVLDALHLRGPSCVVVPDTGTLRGDILATLGMVDTGTMREDMLLVSGVLRALAGVPEIADAVREQILEAKRDLSRTLVSRAVARGEVPPDADPDVFHVVAPALVFFRVTVLGQPVDEEFLTYVTDDVLIPLLTRQRPVPARAEQKESA
ncbi:TetR family transcriptional regulator [Motilibacter rhizosphaerae]|uniref:TetR family transcriptional regulator n=1 Tax=Motilibacter rhizosphaerae TaxID=598652 RepID=A0A4Q7NPC7_9ACTN|nr:TetR/AcrR family transcriptional regulator [Motilibacter rhizosphaerae]RZS87144.1 TetR family transcriptional regulator [Motilibacter rhizosphaerae]